MFASAPRLLSLLLLATTAAACSPPPMNDAGTDARSDAPVDRVDVVDTAPIDSGPPCHVDSDCSDGVFCNGAERCTPGTAGANARGCVASTNPCSALQTCNEAMSRCDTNCATNGDMDGDGHRSMNCGGDDCDDNDAMRFPGNAEVCDTDAHDEDCDVATVGGRDADHDTFVDSACCNVDASGMRHCGEDCNDIRRNVNPNATEVCDRIDNDCNGMVDEGVTISGFHDDDHDLHGDPMRPMDACPFTPGFSVYNDDCDDTRTDVNGGQREVCDGVDNDCDGQIDEDPRPATWYADTDGDGFGSAASGTVVSCDPVPGHVLLGTDCDDTRRAIGPAASEICDGLDNDCNGLADFVVGPNGDFEDDDGDHAPDMRCPVTGTDCDDRDPATHPGAIEICDLRDNDCNSMIDDGTVNVAWWIDADGDGYGDIMQPSTLACMAPAGHASQGGDCDDANGDRHPGVVDTCNGIDDDCDGTIDEDAPFAVYYRDADGDGYGDEASGLSACAQPTGYITQPADCDDTRAAVNRDATETCNGLDDDCDGMVDGSALDATCPAVAHGTQACVSGACGIGRCATGYANCDGNVTNGCETDTVHSGASCGMCGHACAANQTCVASVCVTSPYPSTGAEGPLVASGAIFPIAAGGHNYTTIDIPAGTTVHVTGGSFLDLRATGAIHIAGTIDVSGGNGVGSSACGSNGGGGSTGTVTDGLSVATCSPGGGGGTGTAGSAAATAGAGCGLGGSYGGGAGGVGGGGGGGGGGGYAGGGGAAGGQLRGGAGGGAEGGAAGTYVMSTANLGGFGGYQAAGAPYGGTHGQDNYSVWGDLAGGGGGGGSIGSVAAADLAVASTFYAGSAGGGGGGAIGGGCGGGGGGGAGGSLRISSQVSITIDSTGRVLVHGGNGGGGAVYGGAGGGGSGGVAYLVAPSVSMAGTLDARGGNGGVGGVYAGVGGAGGLGRLRISVDSDRCVWTGSSTPASAAPAAPCTISPAAGTSGRVYVGQYPN